MPIAATATLAPISAPSIPNSCVLRLGVVEDLDRLVEDRLEPVVEQARPERQPEERGPRNADGIASRISGVVITARRLVDPVPDLARRPRNSPQNVRPISRNM